MIKGMLKTTLVIAILSLMAGRAVAGGACLVGLLSGEATTDTISLTFRNLSKTPIRRIDFNCRQASAHGGKTQRLQCSEPNASFLPQTVYTVQYPYPRGMPGPVTASISKVLFSDGYTWQPTPAMGCRVLTIRLPKAKPGAKSTAKG